MTTPTLTITDRVNAGAAWLDEHRPGWWQRIDLDTLDLGDPCHCVLGQEFTAEAEKHSRWWTGYRAAVNQWPDETPSPAKLGFSSRDDGEDTKPFWDELTDAWRALILARRAGTETTR